MNSAIAALDLHVDPYLNLAEAGRCHCFMGQPGVSGALPDSAQGAVRARTAATAAIAAPTAAASRGQAGGKGGAERKKRRRPDITNTGSCSACAARRGITTGPAHGEGGGRSSSAVCSPPFTAPGRGWHKMGAPAPLGLPPCSLYPGPDVRPNCEPPVRASPLGPVPDLKTHAYAYLASDGDRAALKF